MHDIGFSDAVSDVVDIVKYETSRKGRARAKIRGDEYSSYHDSPVRGRSPCRNPKPGGMGGHWRNSSPCQSPGNSPEYYTTCFDRRSRSPSPNPTPTQSEYYGTTQLYHRSRSPSPSSAHSLPVQRRPPRIGRKLPPTPNKPSTLHLNVRSMEGINFPLVSHSPTVPQFGRSPGSINFPKVNASPTHMPKLGMPPGWRGPHNPGFLNRHNRATSSISLPSQRPPRPIDRDHALGPYPEIRHCGGPLPLRAPEEPLSFEAAAAIGRGSRQLPSPLPNGYKPGQREPKRVRGGDRRDPTLVSVRTGRPAGLGPRSDTDEDDWC